MAVAAAWSLLLVVLFLLAIRAFLQAPGFDSGVALYVARGLLEGESPYLQSWEHKAPMIFLINVVGLLLSEGWGIWVVQVGFLVGTCLAAYQLLRPAFGWAATFFAMTVLLVYFARLVQGGNLVEQYALLPQFVALALFAAAEGVGRRTPGKYGLMALGALGAGAVMLRPNLAGVWFAIGLYWLLYRNNVAWKFAWTAVGGVAVLACFVVWLALAGGWPTLAAFWDAAIVYNLHYSDASPARRFVAARVGFEKLHPVAWVLVVGWSIGVWRMLAGVADRGGFAPLARLAVVLLPIELALTGISGYTFGHYYLALIPVACVLSAFTVGQFLDAFSKRLPWATIALFAATVSFYVTSLHADHRDAAAFEGQDPLAEHIRELSKAGDPILVWGPALPYLTADRAAPTRYFYAICLLRGNKRQERIEEFTADVIRRPPVLIVDLRDPSLAPLGGIDTVRSAWRPGNPRLVYDHRSFLAFFEFMDSNYVLAKTSEHYDIYRKVR